MASEGTDNCTLTSQGCSTSSFSLTQPVVRQHLRHSGRCRTHRILHIGYDTDTEGPHEWDSNWRLVSFNRKHNSFEEPRKHCRAVLGVPQFINPGLRRKHDVGLAFFLDYYKHSGSTWSLHGEGQQLQFDTSRYAGFLVWDHKPRELGAKTFEDRAEDARRFLKTYNQWANGETYWYSLEDVDGNPLSSSDGYYDVDLIVTDITPYLGRGDQVKIRGDAAAVAHRLKLPAGVLLVDEFTTELEAAGAESGRAGTETTNQEEV